MIEKGVRRLVSVDLASAGPRILGLLAAERACTLRSAMFLDDRSTWPRREPPRPTPSRRERLMTRLILVYALVLLLTPISIGAAADLIRYLARLAGG